MQVEDEAKQNSQKTKTHSNQMQTRPKHNETESKSKQILNSRNHFTNSIKLKSNTNMMSTHHDGLQQNTKLTKPFYKQEQNAN